MKKLLALLLFLALIGLVRPAAAQNNFNTLDRPSNVTILSKSGIPLISLGSCTLSAAGALSACTALPTTYANAYCFLPANAAATSIAAGWFFCQFSSTTAGTVFLNTYTSGTPTIPSTTTAVTTGSSFTGDTGEEFGITITLPANALGANGAFRISAQSAFTNSGGNKNPKWRYSGNSGTVLTAGNFTTHISMEQQIVVSNRGATGAQVSSESNVTNSGALNNTLAYPAVDTTASSTIVYSGTRNTATDNLVLESYAIEVLSTNN